MGQFTKLVKRTFEFDDEKVTVTFARLRRKDMMKIVPLVAKLNQEKPDGDNAVSIAEHFLGDFSDRLVDYIKEINGLTDASNEPVTIETVVDEAYFTPLLVDIAEAMVEESLPPSKKKNG